MRARCFVWLMAALVMLSPLLGDVPASVSAQTEGSPPAALDPSSGDASPTATETETATPTEIVTETPADSATPTATETTPATPTAPETATPTETGMPSPTATPTGTPTTPSVKAASVDLSGALPLVGGSQSSDSQGNSRLRDGSLGTYWRTNNTGIRASAWVQVDLGVVKPIGEIRWWIGAADLANSFTVAVSTNGSNWTTVASGGDSAIGEQQSAMLNPSVYGRYVRFSFTNMNNTPMLGGLAEVAVYEGAPPPTPIPTPVPPKLSDVKVSVDCLGNPETIKITNTGQSTFTITKVKYLYKDRWYAKNQKVRPGQAIVYKTGSKATGSGVISTNHMLVDAAGDSDGVRITTEMGNVFKYCPPLTGERWIEVNLSSQTLIAWQGKVKINSTLISSGKDGFWTPTGTFYINARYRYKDMAGCEGGECWYVPDVQYAQYFTYEGHAIHAATWHNLFGIKRLSHGCINVPLSFAAWLWNWSTYGTRIWIHY